jgi:hypothetical protein
VPHSGPAWCVCQIALKMSRDARTCRNFAIGRPTLDRWYRRAGLCGPEDRSRNPYPVTPPQWTTRKLLAATVLQEQYPDRGKTKL